MACVSKGTTLLQKVIKLHAAALKFISNCSLSNATEPVDRRADKLHPGTHERAPLGEKGGTQCRTASAAHDSVFAHLLSCVVLRSPALTMKSNRCHQHIRRGAANRKALRAKALQSQISASLSSRVITWFPAYWGGPAAFPAYSGFFCMGIS